MKISPKVVLHTGLIVMLSVIIAWSAEKGTSTNDIPEGLDAQHYVNMAYHILHNKVCSMSYSQDKTKAVPTAYREPGLPFYLSVMMRFSPELREMDLKQLKLKSGGVVALRKTMIPLYVVTSLLAGYLTWLITRQVSLSYLAMMLTGFSSTLAGLSNMLFREHLIALLTIAVAIFLYVAIKTRHKQHFVYLGIALGLLVLTNAVFKFMIYFLLIFLVVLYFKQRYFEKKQILICAVLLLVSYAVPVGGWMTRNLVHFKTFSVTERAGAVLAIRAEYDKMNADEYWGAFLWWTADQFFRDQAIERMKDGTLGRLHRANPKGYYKIAKSQKNFLKQGETFSTSYERDKVVQKRAIKEIIKHPLKHLAVVAPISWRGIFVENGYRVNAPFSAVLSAPILIAFGYLLGGLMVFFKSLKTKNWPVFAVTLVCVYLHGMNSFFTHGLVRYNQPLIPVLAVTFCTAIFLLKTSTKSANP